MTEVQKLVDRGVSESSIVEPLEHLGLSLIQRFPQFGGQ